VIFSAIVGLRNRLYDHGWMGSVRLPVPVVSVGNITVGGTGKSPMIHSLLHALLAEGLRVGVVSRGYGRSRRGVQEVDPTEARGAFFFGDEAFMTKLRYPNVPYFVGEDRAAAGEALLAKYPVDLILADDAFQHRRLWRDIDVVLLDATQKPFDYRLLPLGRGREPISSLSRAQVVVITKSNQASQDDLLELKQKIHKANPVCQVLTSRHNLRTVHRMGGHEELPEGSKVYLFSGLARPESFHEMMRGRFNVVGQQVFSDHYAYTVKDIHGVLSAANTIGASAVVTTEKDAVKVKDLIPSGTPIWVAKIELGFHEDFDGMINAIKQLVR
jgi:tetraacyldisaccharide 4'-kinase